LLRGQISLVTIAVTLLQLVVPVNAGQPHALILATVEKNDSVPFVTRGVWRSALIVNK
jgi:hypothetical protein